MSCQAFLLKLQEVKSYALLILVCFREYSLLAQALVQHKRAFWNVGQLRCVFFLPLVMCRGCRGLHQASSGSVLRERRPR